MEPDLSEWNRTLGRAIVDLRTERGLTQEDLPFERSHASGLENGHHNAHLTTLVKLSLFFKIPLCDLCKRIEREMKRRKRSNG